MDRPGTVKVLAFDTALEACSAALLDGGRVRATRSIAMARGHQERLGPLVAELLAEAELRPADLDRIGVTVGPGSFTGLRVGLAFAKGLGLALGRPVVGVGTLEALAASADCLPREENDGEGSSHSAALRTRQPPPACEPRGVSGRSMAASPCGGGLIVAAIDARREQLYVQLFRNGVAVTEPDALTSSDAAALIADHGAPDVLVGSGARLLGLTFPAAGRDLRPGADPVALARCVATAPEPLGMPRPIYLRAPDAKAPGGLEPAA
jgi:tRNA threonylcarbamoyladenosine biosynthesis protein TsaB